MTDNELLLAISNMMDEKLEPVKDDVKSTRILIENDILPRLQNIEACYTSTYRRYSNGIEEMKALKSDMDIIKKVVAEHSEKLKKLAQHFYSI